jgi:dipeptidyl aminopeptidase/acylaminoacyl peptidase
MQLSKRFGGVGLGIGLCLGLATASTGFAEAPHTVTVRDSLRLVSLSNPQFSPDGRWVAVVESRADPVADEYRTEIMLVDVTTGAVRPFTSGRHHASFPRWSPDGRSLAFLAPDADKHAQIFVASTGGGDAVRVTDQKSGVQQFAFSPDGDRIAFVASDPVPDAVGEDKFKTGFYVGHDDFTVTERPRSSHLYLVPAAGGAAEKLTSGDWSLPTALPPGPPPSPIKWTPDGKALLFVRQETPSSGDRHLTQLRRIDVATHQVSPLTPEPNLSGYPVPSPDGKWIAYWRRRGGVDYRIQDVYLAPGGGGEGRDLTAPIDRDIFGTWWMPDGRSVLVGANDGVGVGLWLAPVDGPAQRLGLGDMMPTNGYWMEGDISKAGAIAIVGQTKNDPSELYLISSPDAAPKKLTAVNSALSDLRLGASEAFTWKSPNGHALDGVLTLPPDHEEGRKYPVVLYIHGGPMSASRLRFGIFQQALASRGFIVFEPNYRGSDNMGDAFHAAIYRDAGQGPGEDVMAGVAALKKRADVDGTRISVSGWSYGGFMTTWLLGHYPATWKAAVDGAAVTNWVEMYDIADGNVHISSQVGGSPYVGDGMSRYQRQSPATAQTAIRTPTLVISDTGDFRVPITQSFSLYRALQDNHVESAFYAVPVRGHSPPDPIRQMDVWQKWIEWLESHQ